MKRKADAMYEQVSVEAKKTMAISEYDADGRPLNAALQAAHFENQVRGGTFDSALKEGKFALVN